MGVRGFDAALKPPVFAARGSLLVMRPARTGYSLRVNLMKSDIAVADAVAADPNGIGFTTYSESANAVPVSLLGACNIQSPATGFTIQSEEYPYSRRLYLYKTSQSGSPLVDMFVEYLNTPEAQELVDLTGFVGQGVREVPVNDQGLRFLSAALPTDAEMTLESLQSMMTDLATPAACLSPIALSKAQRCLIAGHRPISTAWQTSYCSHCCGIKRLS